MFSRANVKRAVCMLAFWAASLAVVCAQGDVDKMPDARKLIAGALGSAGFETTPVHIEPLSSLTIPADAHLKVVSVVTQGSNTVLAKLRCSTSSQCLPFLVLVHDFNTTRNRATELREDRTTSVSAQNRVKEQPLVARGQFVSLVIEKADMRIVLSAICMEGGMRGQIIRVASPDRKRFYRGEVISRTIVKTAL